MSIINSVKRVALRAAIIIVLPAFAHADEVPERADIPNEYKWDLSDMYADTAAWEADFQKMLRVFQKLRRFTHSISKQSPFSPWSFSLFLKSNSRKW
jgi:oligoendopeptidase F